MKLTTFVFALLVTNLFAIHPENEFTEKRIKAPEIEIKDVNGKMINLSSLKGNIVLIDFWASWCKPCRLENPIVVAAYNKYHNSKFENAKNFEIFSVSLDKNKASWTNAIQKDKLNWENHGCEFKVWQSEVVKKYGIKGIPQNVLIDAEGYVIATNLRGEKLEEALSKLVK